ncbi:PH domain-containing protein [Bradyrhizobium japonicum]|uniref:PH domain-containing protein n=1 Tax=Bradyrhizobium japonicum TaxID=375 RepID=UPI002FF5806D
MLQPGESVIIVGKLHWIIYAHALGFVFGGLVLAFLVGGSGKNATTSDASGLNGQAFAGLLFFAFLVLATISLVRTWFRQWTTELVITDRRVIYKTGFIRRSTVEMNMDKVERAMRDFG